MHVFYHLDEAFLAGPYDEINLGWLSVRFPEATFLDAALHTWMTEETTRSLFTVDWLGFPHMAGECLRCVDELPVEIDVSRLEERVGKSQVSWRDGIRRMIEARNPELLTSS